MFSLRFAVRSVAGPTGVLKCTCKFIHAINGVSETKGDHIKHIMQIIHGTTCFWCKMGGGGGHLLLQYRLIKWHRGLVLVVPYNIILFFGFLQSSISLGGYID